MREGYKNTSIGEIPKSWKLSKLGEIADLKMGQSPSSTTYNENAEGEYLIQGNADIKNRRTTPRFWTSQPTKLCEYGDIIMTVRAPVGAIAKSKHKACIGRGVCAINTKNVDMEFLYQTLINLESSWVSISQGSTFTAVNSNEIRNVLIPIPNFSEQQKIAKILSTVDKKIDVIDQRIAETQELKKGLMQQLLTKGIGHTQFKDSPLGEIPESWKVVELRDIGVLNGGFAFKSNSFNDIGDGYQVIRMSNVQPYGLELRKSPVYKSKISDKERRFLLKSGDILITLTGTVGKTDYGNVAYIETSNTMLLNQRVGRFFYNEEMVGLYMFYLFNFSIFRKQFFESGKGGTGNQANVGKEGFESIKVLLPPKEEQNQIVEVLSAIDKKLQIQEDKKTEYQQLKKGLMQQLLTGKIRVNV